MLAWPFARWLRCSLLSDPLAGYARRWRLASGQNSCAIITEFIFARSLIVLLLLTASSFASVTVNTIDATSGKPLEKVQVRVIVGQAVQSGVTDAEGKWKLDDTPFDHATITVQKEGWCPLKWDLAEASPANSDNLTFALAPAAPVGGVVQDAAGKKIAGVKVTVNFPQRLWGAHVPVEDFTLITDSNGQWTADFVPKDAAYVHLELLHPSYRWNQGQPSRGDILSGHTVLTMEAVLAFRGRVLDPQGRPVAGATVFRGEQWGIMGLESENQATTDTNGFFSFPPGQPGAMQVAAFADKFGPVLQDVELKADVPPVDLTLTAPHIRRIRVIDENGAPLTNLEVQASGWRTFQYPPGKYTTDVTGRIVITNAPADEIKLDFLAPQHMGLRFYPMPPSNEEQVVQLGPALRLHGKVTDALTGKPMPAFQVVPGFPQQVFVDGHLTNQGAQWNDFQKKSFKDGAYDWTFDEPELAGTDKPYDFLVRVDAEGYAPTVSRVFKATEKDAEFDFQVGQPTYLNGTVRFKDGSPAVGAQIYLANQAWELQEQNGVMQNQRNLSALTSDTGGHFQLMQQQSPKLLGVWHEGGFATVDFSDFQKTNEIVLTRWAKIEGVLWRGNRLAAQEPVGLCFEQKWMKVGNHSQSANTGVFSTYEATTDVSGHFIFDKIRPGVLTIARVEPIRRPDNYGMAFGDVWAACRLLVVNATEGGAVSVKVGGNGRTVAGRFSSTNDFSTCRGTLTRSLPPIPYPASLDAAGKNQWAADWFWSDAGEPYRIWLGGPPQAEAPHYRGQTDHSWAVKINPDGSFKIDDVPPGTYTLMAIFMPKDQGMPPGLHAPGPGVELKSITQNFTVAPDDHLADLPPQDLGTIGESIPASVEIPVAEPSAHEPVTAAMKADPAPVKAGNTFQLLVRIRIADGHHIYGANPKSKTFTGTSVSLELPDGIESVADWTAPTPSVAPDGEPVYTNSVTFSRTLKLNGAAASGALSLKGELRFQVCDDQLCWPPKTIAIASTVTVQPTSKGTP